MWPGVWLQAWNNRRVPGSDGLLGFRQVARHWRKLNPTPVPEPITGIGISILEGADMTSAHVPAMLPNTEPMEAQFDYLVKRVEATENRISAEAATARTATGDLALRVSAIERAVEEKISSVERKATENITGKNGRGLSLAGLGVFLATLGSALTYI